MLTSRLTGFPSFRDEFALLFPENLQEPGRANSSGVGAAQEENVLDSI